MSDTEEVTETVNGPWRAEENEVNAYVFDADGRHIATVHPKPHAHLIAAAPQLYEALKATAAVVAGDTMSKNGLINALELARAALSAAAPNGGGR